MFPAGGAQSLNPPAGGAQSSHGRRWSRSILQRLGIRLLLDRTCTQLTCMMRRSVGITASSLPPACLHPPACFWGRSIFLWSRSILQRPGIRLLPVSGCAPTVRSRASFLLPRRCTPSSCGTAQSSRGASQLLVELLNKVAATALQESSQDLSSAPIPWRPWRQNEIPVSFGRHQ